MVGLGLKVLSIMADPCSAAVSRMDMGPFAGVPLCVASTIPPAGSRSFWVYTRNIDRNSHRKLSLPRNDIHGSC